MARIRVVGRGSLQGRCAYCHDTLEGARPTRCIACATELHAECAMELGGCPTLGCVGSLGLAEEPHPTPTLRARFGPYARLTASAAWNGFVLLVVFAITAGALRDPAGLWDQAKRNPLVLSALGLVMLLSALRSGLWAVRLPRAFRETARLLNETTPCRMKLRVVTEGHGRDQATYACLEPLGPGTSQKLELDGILPPWWLISGGHRDTNVWVYTDGKGPFLIEFPTGRLAIVHPD